jgi:hypothetical protein
VRLVLVDHGGERVRGDSAVFAANSAEWAELTFRKLSISHLAPVAARLLDENEGRLRWRYEYHSFGPLRTGAGYDVFACARDREVLGPEHFRYLTDVISGCFYMGFVASFAPAIPLKLFRDQATLDAQPAFSTPQAKKQAS